MNALKAATAALLLASGLAASASAEAPASIQIGVLNDMSGPYSDSSGRGSLIAAQMAAEDFMASHPGVKVQVIGADHQNKPDVGSVIAREWVKLSNVDAIFDISNSAVALAVNDIVRGTHAALISSNAATSELTGKYCSPNTVQWTYDTWALGHTLAQALKNEGAQTWYMVASDNSLGKSLVQDTSYSVEKLGGKVLGTSYVPVNTSDYSSVLLQSAASNADVIAFATAGGDTASLIKQSAEFGMRKPGRMFAALLATTNDVKAAGLDTSQGLLVVAPFYSELDATSRAWSREFEAHTHGGPPTASHAGTYSSVKAYLESVVSTGTTDARAVIRTMKATTFHDGLFGDVIVRPDGRAIHNMYLLRVRNPQQSKGSNDIEELVETLTGEQAFRPIDQGGCNLDQMR